MVTASTYVSRSLATDDASLGKYSALLGVTSAPLSTDLLRWMYRDNPSGRAVGTNAYVGDELAAHYATIPVEAMLDGERVRGLLSLNTATHPTHQGKGLFTRLAEETYARGAKLGYRFVVGVANANSTPGFTKKLGFQLVSPLDVLVGVGGVRASHDDVGFALTWNAPSLKWRLSRPGARYVAQTSGDRTVVYAVAHKLGILAYMTDAPPALVPELPAPRRRQALRMWIGIDPKPQRVGLLAPLPERLRPSPLNLIFRDLTGKGRTLSRESTRFTLLDFDAY